MGGYLGDPKGREAAIEARQGADIDVRSQVDSFRNIGGYDKGPKQQRTSSKIDVGSLFQQTPLTKQHQALRPVTGPVSEPLSQAGVSPSQKYGSLSPHLGGLLTGIQNEGVLRQQSEVIKEKRQAKIDKQIAHWNNRILGDWNPTKMAAEYVGLTDYEVVDHTNNPSPGNLSLNAPSGATNQQRIDYAANKALGLYNLTNTAKKFGSGNPFEGLEAIAQLGGMAVAGTAHQAYQGIQNILSGGWQGSYPNALDLYGNYKGLAMGLLGRPPIQQDQ